MRKSKVAILGSGAIAREHIFALQESKLVEVIAVCDLSPARAESLAERFGIAHWFTNHLEMLEKTASDFIHITTPPQSHFALSKDCLERGRHVICEKPITTAVAEFEILRDIARSKNLRLFENQNYRMHSSVRKIEDLAKSGALGEIIEVQIEVRLNIHAKGSIYNDPNLPHFAATMRGGVAGDFLTHMTYLAQMFIGYKAETQVLWNTFNNNSTLGQDEFRAQMLAGKSRGYLSFSGNAQPPAFWVRVIGTNGLAEANLFEPPRMTLRKLRRSAAPIATFVDGIAEAKAVFRGTFGGLYRKFSGAARYDGLQSYLESCHAAREDESLSPVTLQQLESTGRLIEKLCEPRRER